MISLIAPLVIGACVAHTPVRVHYSDIRSYDTISVEHKAADPKFTDEFQLPADILVYSKKINYWVNGHWVGRGRHKHYVAGHWERRVVVPPSDYGYVWVSGVYTRKPSKHGHPRGWVPGHWEKR
jgi:hypothetical protein